MPRRSALCSVLLAALLALALPGGAAARPYAPADGRIALGLAGRANASAFDAAHGRAPDVFQTFVMFGGPLDYAFERAARLGAAPMLHVSTADGPGAAERVTPKGIAQGRADRWLLALQARAAAAGGPVYVRPMGEMNGSWNQYSAYRADGRRRDAAHSTTWFRRAWRRIAIVLRGGRRVDARLAARHLAPLRHAAPLPRARVALVWCPQVAGAPDVPGNAPRAYWPGRRFVDWVATDFYSKFPNFGGLERFYRAFAFAHRPFAFGEWALWDRDDPAFVGRLFAWVRSHRRTRMLIYNQGYETGGPFDLARYPRSSRAIRSATRSARFER